MENRERHQNNYPLFLKLLLGFAILFLGSLGLILGSIIFNMLAFVYGMENLLLFSYFMEQIGIITLGLSVFLGGGVSFIGLLLRQSFGSNSDLEQTDKAKNEDKLYDIRDYGLSVEDVLADMNSDERERLSEKLAESRLAIREDGVLIPVEQAENLQRIERFMNG